MGFIMSKLNVINCSLKVFIIKNTDLMGPNLNLKVIFNIFNGNLIGAIIC